MRQEYDRRMRAKETYLLPGEKVMLRVERTNKRQPFWDSRVYTVVEARGSLIVAERDGQRVTRNVSFFKRVIKETAEFKRGRGGQPEAEEEPEEDAVEEGQEGSEAV